MASINVRSGYLYFDFRFRGVRCREYTRFTDTSANRKKMQRILTRIEADISLGRFEYERYFPGSPMATRFLRQGGADAPRQSGPDVQSLEDAATALPTFADFAEGWKRNKQVEWRHSYRVAIDSILRHHVLPVFGDVPLNEIDRPLVLDFRTKLSREGDDLNGGEGPQKRALDPSTINRIVGVVRMVLDEAALQYGFQNPCTNIKRLKLRRKDIEPFSMVEMRMILARVRTDYRPYLTFRFFTGVRSGEAHGLKWKHVDWERRQILIRETFIGGRTEQTKTDGSQREIYMSQPVIEALVAQRPEGYDHAPERFSEDYVFRTRNGMPINNTNFNNRVWKPLLRHLGIKYRRPYQMRHTCATLWLAAGESPEWIARQLGHSTTEMLFRTYSRYVPNLMRRDGNAFDTLVTGALNGGVDSHEPEEAGDPSSQAAPSPTRGAAHE